MSSIQLEYCFGGDLSKETLKRIKNLSEGFLKAEDFIKEYKDVKIRSYLHKNLEDFSYKAILFSNNKEELRKSAETFVDDCGIPTFVKGDYELIENYIKDFKEINFNF